MDWQENKCFEHYFIFFKQLSINFTPTKFYVYLHFIKKSTDTKEIKWILTCVFHQDLGDAVPLDVSVEGRDVLMLQVQQHNHLSHLEILLHLSGQ